MMSVNRTSVAIGWRARVTSPPAPIRRLADARRCTLSCPSVVCMSAEGKAGGTPGVAAVEAAVGSGAARLAVAAGDDEDAAAIAGALGGCGTLRVLDLRRGRFGVRGAGALGALLRASAPPLIRLDVSGGGARAAAARVGAVDARGARSQAAPSARVGSAPLFRRAGSMAHCSHWELVVRANCGLALARRA